MHVTDRPVRPGLVLFALKWLARCCSEASSRGHHLYLGHNESGGGGLGLHRNRLEGGVVRGLVAAAT